MNSEIWILKILWCCSSFDKLSNRGKQFVEGESSTNSTCPNLFYPISYNTSITAIIGNISTCIFQFPLTVRHGYAPVFESSNLLSDLYSCWLCSVDGQNSITICSLQKTYRKVDLNWLVKKGHKST